MLQSTPRPGPRTNPYVSQLHESLRAAGVDVRPFSWRTALLGRYDVVHLHWPEILLGGSDTVRAAARRALTALFVVRLAVCRTPVVVFLCLMSLWWLAFGPIHSNLPDIAIALGLSAPLRGPTRAAS